MQTTTTCNTSSLDVYVPSTEKPWNAEKIKHLYRRLQFGASQSEIDYALTQTPESLVNSLIDDAVNIPDINTIYDDGSTGARVRAIDDFLTKGLRGTLILFWHNHFVTQLQVYNSGTYLNEYYNLLHNMALGDFKEFVRIMGINDAMLIFLNGFENVAGTPNENYARELYELFTLGVDNGYTQEDIEETARALTGYNHRTERGAPISFDVSTFDNSSKTIFGQTGNWGYDDVINILFQEKEQLIGRFICTKLYKYFVSPVINESIINELADTFVLDFNIENVLRILFKSEHFFDENAIGTIIKSPYELFIGSIKTSNPLLDDENKNRIFFDSKNQGQELFNPIDVAGWQGNHDWIDSDKIIRRWKDLANTFGKALTNDPETLRTFAIEVSGNSKDPYVVTKSIVDAYMPKELTSAEDYDTATEVFKHTFPDNFFNGFWDLSFDEVPTQTRQLLRHIATMPEVQLK